MAAGQAAGRFFTQSRVAAGLLAALLGLATRGNALAASGTWTSTASGTWGTTSNWSGGIVGTGTAFTATFAPDIASNVTVENNQQRAIGTLVFGTAASPSGAGNWILTGSTVVMNMGDNTQNGTITVNSFGSVTISSTLQSGTSIAVLVKNGAGKLVLANAANSIGNNVAITNGTLEISDNLQLGANPGAFVPDRLQISNGATLRTSASVTLGQNRGITIGSGGGTLSINGGGLTYAGRLTGVGQTATVTGSNALTLSNATGTATNVNWDFSSNNGIRTFFQGTNALGTGSVRVRSGVRLTSQSTTTGTLTNAVTLDSGAGLTARSSGGAATYSNVTFPSSGTVVLNKDDQTTSNLTISTGGTLTGNLTVDTSPGGSNAVADVYLDGVFSGAGGLVKSGTGATGKVILRGINTYSGNTTINTGTLRLGTGGSIANSGTISVASGAWFDTTGVSGGFSLAAAKWLQGSGTVLGSVAAQGTIAPGLSGSAGTLSFDSALVLDSGSILSYGLNGANTTTGGGINALSAVSGDLTLDGTLNVTEIGVGSFLSATAGNTWRLITYTGSLTNNGLELGSTPTLSAGLSLSVDTSTPNEVNLIVVPEPVSSAGAALGIGAVAAVARMRRRCTRSARRE